MYTPPYPLLNPCMQFVQTFRPITGCSGLSFKNMGVRRPYVHPRRFQVIPLDAVCADLPAPLFLGLHRLSSQNIVASPGFVHPPPISDQRTLCGFCRPPHALQPLPVCTTFLTFRCSFSAFMHTVRPAPRSASLDRLSSCEVYVLWGYVHPPLFPSNEISGVCADLLTTFRSTRYVQTAQIS